MSGRVDKADLTLFYRLVKELEASLDEAYSFRDDPNTEKNMPNYFEFVVKLSKSIGCLTGIVNEAQLLGSDLAKISQNSISTFYNSEEFSQKSAEDYIKSLSGPTGCRR